MSRRRQGVELGDGSRLDVAVTKDPNPESRNVYLHSITNNEGTVIFEERRPWGEPYSRYDPRGALATFCSFLMAAGEANRTEMGGRTSDNSDIYPEHVKEFAYQYSDEIAMAQIGILDAIDPGYMGQEL